MCAQLQLDSLPLVLQEKIAAMVTQLGHVHVFNLRSCSRQWLSLCNEVITLASVPADQLASTLPLLNALPRLHDIIIRGRHFPATSIASSALSPLRAGLNTLSLTSASYEKARGVSMDVFLTSSNLKETDTEGHSSEGEEECERKLESKQHTCAIVVESLAMLLQPWAQTLEHLHLDHCYIPQLDSSMQSAPSFFAGFPCLRTLHLLFLHASSSTGPGMGTFNLSGCKALQLLDCRSSSICSLNLSGCSALLSLNCQRNKISTLVLSGCNDITSLDCQRNQLASLTLVHCGKLKRLECGHNKLASIELDPLAELETLRCAGADHQPIIAGTGTFSDLVCTEGSLRRVIGAQRQSLVRLSVRNSLVLTELKGFKDLRFLRCKFGCTNLGSIDLTGCSSVELDCHCEDRLLPLSAQQNVQKLTLTQLGTSCPDFEDFTHLQEVSLVLDQQTSLDMFECRAIRKLTIAGLPGSHCLLAMIHLYQHKWLEQLHIKGLPDLISLYLGSLSQLKVLTCIGSSLQSIDTSRCHFLTTLDVSHSLRLRCISTSSHSTLLHIKAEGCGIFECNEEAHASRRFVQEWDVAELDAPHTQAATRTTQTNPTRNEQQSQIRNSTGFWRCFGWLCR